MKKISLGIIGCGKHGRRHIDATRELAEDFEIRAVYDIDPDIMHNVAEENYLMRGECSVNSLVTRDDVKAVVIATPPRFHLAAMSLAVAMGKHVLCEKPLWESSISKSKAQYVFADARQKGLIITSCHPRRYDPLYYFLKEHMETWLEGWGKLVSFNFRFSYRRPSSEWRKEDSLLMDHLNHEIDLLHFLCGEQEVRLQRVRDGFDHYDVVGETASGINISFSGLRRLESRVYCNELELIFEGGRVLANGDLIHRIVNNSIIEHDFEDNTRIARIGTHSPMFSIRDIMRNFAHSIRGDSSNYLTHEEMIRNTTACTALAETGSYNTF